MCMSIFHPEADKGLIYTMMTTSRINLMVQTTLLHTKLCKMYRVYCLNYIMKESLVNMKNTNFGNRLLRCNQLFIEWVQIIKYFQTHCKLLKIIIWNMLFPTKLTPLINTRGLIDSASLKNHHNNRLDSGSHKWPKTFFGRCTYIHIYIHPYIHCCHKSARAQRVKIAASSKIVNCLSLHVIMWKNSLRVTRPTSMPEDPGSSPRRWIFFSWENDNFCFNWFCLRINTRTIKFLSCLGVIVITLNQNCCRF